MRQDLNVGSIGANSTTPHLATDAYVNSSTTATMPHFNMDGNSSIMSVPYIRGGYTSLLLRADPEATLQPASRKLNFDGPPNQENM